MNRIYIDMATFDGIGYFAVKTYSENKEKSGVTFYARSNNPAEIKEVSDLFKWFGCGETSYSVMEQFAIASWDTDEVWPDLAFSFVEHGVVPFRSIMQNPLSKYNKNDIFLNVYRIATQGKWVKNLSMRKFLKSHDAICKRLGINASDIVDNESIEKTDIYEFLPEGEEMDDDNRSECLSRLSSDIFNKLIYRITATMSMDLYYESLVK